MSETDEEVFPGRKELFTSCFPALASSLLVSLKIFLRNKQLFLSIFALTALPLSLLLFSLSISSHPLMSHIYHLETVALLSSTHFEARHVWKESRADALSLLRLKVIFFLPSYLLSLIAAITSVHSTASAFNGTRPTLLTAATAVKLTWKRLLATTLFVYGISLMYGQIPRTLAVLFGSPGSRFIILIVGSSIEIYLMAVLSIGLVVSIVDEKSGWDAIRVGSGVMAERRVSGWVLSGLFVFISGMIARQLGKEMDGRDLLWESSKSTATRVGNGVRNKAGLIFLYGVGVLWSYVVTTVFYCDCRKRHMIRREDESISITVVDL